MLSRRRKMNFFKQKVSCCSCGLFFFFLVCFAIHAHLTTTTTTKTKTTVGQLRDERARNAQLTGEYEFLRECTKKLEAEKLLLPKETETNVEPQVRASLLACLYFPSKWSQLWVLIYVYVRVQLTNRRKGETSPMRTRASWKKKTWFVFMHLSSIWQMCVETLNEEVRTHFNFAELDTRVCIVA